MFTFGIFFKAMQCCYLLTYACHAFISLCLLLEIKLADRVSAENVSHLMGPIFIEEPPSRTHFSNTTGAVITCSATSAIPPVKIWWVLADGQTTVTDVPGLRYVRPNGQLAFPPFPLNQYRQDIHSTTYRCMASNSFGIIRSRDCQVRAVVHQIYKMQVYDEFVIRENMAIMRCHVPSIVREYVRVVAWLREEQVLVTATHNPHSGRFSILSTGELLIRNTSFGDAGSYRCQTRHQLTDELRTSEEAGRLIVTEPHNGVAPRLWAHTTVRCDQNGMCDLTCVAHSWPLSTYRWLRESDSGVLIAANLYANVEIRESNTLVFRPTIADLHEGQWICMANNSIGEEKVVIRVSVVSPLVVTIEPKQAQVDAGRPSTFNCSTHGGPPVRPPVWYHNAQPLMNILREHLHDQRIRLIEPHILHIASVHREDIGVYQCVVQSEHEESQASVELKLGDVAPMLLETFAEKQIIEQGVTSISLRCAAVGTPLPQIRWLLDEQPIPNLSRFRVGDHVTNDGKVVSFVNISNIRVVDGGEYSCVASNEVGKVTFQGQVLVTGGPHLRTSFWGHHNLSVVAGLDTVVRCPVIAYPIESVIWEHNGNVLPTNHRQSIDPITNGYGGILRISDVHATQDSGDYVCTVRVANNADIRPVRGSVQMNVHYAPKIDRHTLPSHLAAKQGDRIKLMCSVIEGDQPIQIQWLRNNRAVKSSEQISVQNGEDYSLLTFKSVLLSHSDQWTCQAKNNFANDNSSISIVVNVPPKWIIEPKSIQVILGKSVTINCQAEGYPKPKITWKKAIVATSFEQQNEFFTEEKQWNTQSHEFRDILSSYRYQVFSNGSLYLQETEVGDAGLYMCQISNGIGTDLSKVIQVQVQQPPRVETKFVSESVIRGATATLQCRAEGDPVLRAEWNRDMQPIDLGPNQRYMVKEDTTRGSITSYLEITDSRRLDSALFTCIISNNYGSDSTNIQLIVQEIPEPPRDAIVSEIGSRSAKVRWKPSFAGNSAIIGFIIEYRAQCVDKTMMMMTSTGTGGGGTGGGASISSSSSKSHIDEMIISPWKDFFINDPNAQSFVLRDLYPWCAYELQLRAKNSIGISDASQTVSFTTAEEMPGGPPLEVSVEPLSSNSLKIKWKPPDKHLQFGQIKGYYIGYRLVDVSGGGARSFSLSNENNVGGEQFAYKNVEANSVESNTFEVAYLTNLKKHTLYSVVVQAFNSAGAGPRSDEITVRTLSVQKQSTVVLEVVSTDSNSITLHWEVDLDTVLVDVSPNSNQDGGQNLEFILHISEEGTGEWIEKRLSPQLRRHVESGLKCGTKYLLYMTLPGQSAAGEMITARTKGTVAISPSVEEFLATNSTAVALNFHSWYNGGCPIRNYSVKYRQIQHKHWKVLPLIKYDPQEQRPLVIGNLEPNHDYIISVVASSTAGMTEAMYNFTTWNSSALIRLTAPDIASSEFNSSNAPFHNVTILLPIIISILVLVAVLSTFLAFWRKQDVFHDVRECRTNSAQNLHRLRTASVRSKEDDINEMLAYPMTDYHSLCINNVVGSKSGKLLLNETSTHGGGGGGGMMMNMMNNGGVGGGSPAGTVTVSHHHNNNHELVYGKSAHNLSTMLYSSPKRTLMEQQQHLQQQTTTTGSSSSGGSSMEMQQIQQQQQRPSTRVTVNSHHIYAEPNASMMQQGYAQPRCLLTNLTSTATTTTTGESSILNEIAKTNSATMNPANESYRALITTNAHI